MSYGAFTRALSDELRAAHTSWDDAHRRVFNRWLAEGRHEPLIRYLTENFDGAGGGEEYISLLAKDLAKICQPALIRALYAPLVSRRCNHFFWLQAQIQLYGFVPVWVEALLQRIDPHRRRLAQYKVSLLTLMREFRTLMLVAGQIDVSDIERDITAFENDQKSTSIVVSAAGPELNEDGFWILIDDARATSDIDDDIVATIEASLAALNSNEILRFQAILERFLDQSYSWELWAAAYAIRGGCGDDEFDYFRQWLILRGRLTYEVALANPVAWALSARFDGSLHVETLRSAAPKAYLSRAGKEMHSRRPARIKPRGEAWEESEFAIRFPELAARFALD